VCESGQHTGFRHKEKVALVIESVRQINGKLECFTVRLRVDVSFTITIAVWGHLLIGNSNFVCDYMFNDSSCDIFIFYTILGNSFYYLVNDNAGEEAGEGEVV